MTLSDVKKNPAEFLYLFATDKFLSKIDAKHAAVIRKKQGNQYKVLLNACEKEKADYATTVKQLNQSLIENFGHSGADCLKILADGGEIAGKNWSAGIYGIGATTYEGFSGTDITVNKETGKLMQGGQEIAGQTAIYNKNSTTYTATVDGTTYTSQFAKGSYSAGTYTNAEGKTFNATGTEVGLSGVNNIWTSIQSFAPIIQQVINWLASLFPEAFTGRSLITSKDTIPAQSDGFVQSSSLDLGTVGIFAGIAAFVYAITRKKNK